MFHPTSLVGCFSQRAQPASCRTTQMDSFFLGAASVNEFSRLQRVQSAVSASELNRCRVTKIDSFSSRLCQTQNSSGCCSQRVQPAVSASKIKRSASMIVLSMAVVIVMLWRWRCFFFLGWFMHVLLSLTIRFPHRDVLAAAKMGGLLQPRPTCFAPVTDKRSVAPVLHSSVHAQ